MLKVIPWFLIALTMTVSAADTELHFRPLRLKDGSYLFINLDDTTDMLDKNSNPIKMEDGVEMELEDGTIILMKNQKLWHPLHNDCNE